MGKPQVSMGDVVASYLARRRRAVANQRLSPGMARSDEVTLGQLCRYWKGRSAATLDSQALEEFFDQLRDSGNGPATINRKVSQVRVFHRWAVQRGLLQPTMCEDLTLDTVPEKDRRRLRWDQLRRVYEEAPDPYERWAMALAVHTAGRDGELCSRRVADVDLQRQRIRWESHKTKRLDWRPFTQELDTEVRSWFLAYQSSCGPLQDDWYLIPRRMYSPGGGWDWQPARERFDVKDITKRRLAAVLGVTPKSLRGEGTHTLRRSAARCLFDWLVEDEEQDFATALEVVRNWLQHSNVAITAHYIGVDRFRLERDAALSGRSFLSRDGGNVVKLRRTSGT